MSPRQPTPDLLAAGQRQPQEELTTMFGTTLDRKAIRRDGGTQPRAGLDAKYIEEIADKMRDGAWNWSRFDLPVVFYDGMIYWLADGFHRDAAAELAGFLDMPCDVRQGTLRDARWFSFSANKNHGLRRSDQDRERILRAIADDPEWISISKREIARHTGIPESTVRHFLDKLSAQVAQIEKQPQVQVTRGNSTYTMNTANLTRTSESLAPQAVILTAMREWVHQWEDAADPLQSLLSGDKIVLNDFKSCLSAPATKPDILTAAQRLLAEVKPEKSVNGLVDVAMLDGGLQMWVLNRFTIPAQRRQALQDLARQNPSTTQYWNSIVARLETNGCRDFTPQQVRDAASRLLSFFLANPEIVPSNGVNNPAPTEVTFSVPKQQDISLADLRAALLDLFTLPASASNREILEAAITAQSLARSFDDV